jgi:hypothetical protein
MMKLLELKRSYFEKLKAEETPILIWSFFSFFIIYIEVLIK